MKNKQYIFLFIIVIILYLLYLIIDYKYKEYKINSHIENIEVLNEIMEWDIMTYKQQYEYLNTKAYKVKTLKEEQSMKQKWEVVIYITGEERFNKFTQNETHHISPITREAERKIQDGMDIYEKWIYFLFKKDIR